MRFVVGNWPIWYAMCASLDTEMPTPSSAQRSAMRRHVSTVPPVRSPSRLCSLISMSLPRSLAAVSTSSRSNGTPARPVWPSTNTRGSASTRRYISVVCTMEASRAKLRSCTLATR